MKEKFIIFLFVIFALPAVYAQSDLAVGEWKTHFSYSEALDLLQLGDDIYVATTNTLYSLNLSDGLCTRIGITEGLSDIGISHLFSDDEKKTLLICYENSNVDLYKDGRVYNIPDLYAKQMAGDKSIYAAYINDSKAYIACGFGIMVLDMEKKYIQETWFFQHDSQTFTVYDVCVNNDTVYAATAEGIYRNFLSNRKIAQLTTWEKLNSLDFRYLEFFNNKIYAVRASSVDVDTVWNADGTYEERIHSRSNSVYTYDNSVWNLDSSFGYEEVRDLRTVRNRLMFTFWNKVVSYGVDAYGKLYVVNSFGSSNPQSAICDEEDYIWIADKGKGLVRQLWTDMPKYYVLDGPITDGVWAMNANSSGLAVIHEAPHNGWTPAWSHIRVSTYKDLSWNTREIDLDYRDAFDILLPSNDMNEYYISSYLNGLLHVKDGIIDVYNESNSSLQDYQGYVRAGKIKSDSNKNIWVTNPLAAKPLSVKTPGGDWYNYDISYSSGEIVGDLLIDRRNWIWIVGNRETSLLIYNTNGTLSNTSDDRLVKLNTTLTEETGAFSYIYALAEDKDGEIWLGTDKGIKIYYSPSRLMDYPGTLPYAPRVTMDSLTELLLYHEAVTCIEVDAGNRKWVGTDNAGIFLLSEDGEKELLHFTKENSPLISNNIRDIAIIGSTGEVFIGTDKGLESFRYTATEAAENYEELKIFPNPVKNDFASYISISGLMDDSEVKITDAKGSLVYRTKSFGGTAVWNACRFDGKRVSTGVYFVHACDANGKEKACGKILFIK